MALDLHSKLAHKTQLDRIMDVVWMVRATEQRIFIEAYFQSLLLFDEVIRK